MVNAKETVMKIATVLFSAVLFTTSIPLLSLSSAGQAAIIKKKLKKYVPYSDTIGWKLCQDKENFDCIIVKEKIVEEKIMTKRGEKIIKKRVFETWEELFPDAAARELVQKLNRLNIKLKKSMLIAVPKDKNKTLADFSPFPKWIAAPEKELIIFDPALLALAAYSPQGKLLRWMPAIGGMDRCIDTWRRCRTIVGELKVTIKGDEKTRSHKYPLGCPRKEPCAPMPWFVGFYKRLFGFHASEKMVGKHDSHGCVRLFLNDARWLHQNFAEERKTKVIIKKYPHPNRS